MFILCVRIIKNIIIEHIDSLKKCDDFDKYFIKDGENYVKANANDGVYNPDETYYVYWRNFMKNTKEVS